MPTTRRAPDAGDAASDPGKASVRRLRQTAERLTLEQSAAGASELTEQNRRFEAALANMSQGLCMFDAESRLVVCNHRYHEIFGLAPGELAFGITQDDLCRILIAKGFYPPSVTPESIRESTRVALLDGDGLPVLRELADGRVIAIRYRSMEGGGWVSTFEDITAQRRNEARIAHLARHDALTDLPNPRTLREEGRALALRADRREIAAYYFDLDRFKLVNDTYGHGVGDELLRAVADRLRAALGAADGIVGRLGGDEFALLRLVRSEAEAEAFAEALLAAIVRPYALSCGRLDAGVSIGVALRRAGAAEDVETLLQNADLALRHAKSNGRGTVHLFDPALSEAARQRRVLEAELRTALAENQFELHYQPLVELGGQRTVGVEALLRWRHPERGLVSPVLFIPLAEEMGFIVPLGDWVIRQACRDAAKWPDHVVVAVNVSGIQLHQKGFAASVLAALREAGLAPGRLEVEITESVLIDESEASLDNLETLRAAGIRFAMDDFGTGYSSLSYLRRFPIDKIKIDRSFMKDAQTNADALAIIRAIAGLGASLGITTLVEGVETEEQLGIARAEGIDQVQGYLFSRPQPKAEIEGKLG
ncbi:hypothetical protein GCM10011390_13670 [Aureimonas endophytica]|uniref:Diguanylate cyclase (GGDEF)-like protein n=1 Tax=Aureimonas endophytica TaxID=2027858 RepID=A0A917E365_9HYPH|nr:EAL domain-containing protein [Aureimonas endophytica]GGD96181.1 hypothetical protein GCM10011390_13670 [Aureimonas endophytica]